MACFPINVFRRRNVDETHGNIVVQLLKYVCAILAIVRIYPLAIENVRKTFGRFKLNGNVIRFEEVLQR